MANLVGGFLLPHVPAIPLGGFGADPAQTKTVYDAFDLVADKLKALQADTVIIIGDDHYESFGPHCIPSCLIVTGDIEISAHAQTLGLGADPIANNEPLAQHILQTGFGEGIDWAFAKSLGVDHSVGVPYHMSVKQHPEMRVIPVYLNDVVEPFIPSRRAYQVGQSIRRAIDSFPGDDRVVIFGTGGISHWVGAPGMGIVNEEFDRDILDKVLAGDVESIIALSDQSVLEAAGNGALEIKNWLCALGAMQDATAEFMAYEPIPQWVTGCGFAELKLAS